MRVSILVGYCSVVLVVAVSASAQGTFQNLNFELGNPGLGLFVDNVPVAQAVPDWLVFYGNVQQTQINYNDPSTGATAVGLFGWQLLPH